MKNNKMSKHIHFFIEQRKDLTKYSMHANNTLNRIITHRREYNPSVQQYINLN